MALINTSLPNLIQGVSQQPDVLRYDGQCEEQENALSSVVDGLKKRPNTRHVARLLETAIDGNSFVHFVNRSESEKYVIIHDGSSLYAYNVITGAEATINGSTGGFDCTGRYLESSTPLQQIKALTVADNTFLLNTEKIVRKNDNTLSPPISTEAVATVMQGDYGKLYKVEADRALKRAEISVSITPSGTKFLHTFSITDGAVGYGIAPDGSFESPPQNIKIYPKGFTANHPNTIEGVVDDASGSGPTASQVISLSPSTLTLDEEITEWEAEPPKLRADLGAIGAKSGSSTTTPSNTDSEQITEKIFNSLSVPADYAAAGITTSERDIFVNNFEYEKYGNSIYISVKDGAANVPAGEESSVSFTAKDGLSGEGLKVAHKSTSSITDLPIENQHGFKIKISGDVELEQDDYYVRFETNGGVGFGAGSYVETSGDGVEQEIDSNTFPFRLINTGLNTFSLKSIDTDIRQAGDDDTNPFPSFVDNKISNMFFYKDRLGFLSGNNVVFSEVGKFFNFFRTTVLSQLDSDPIDVSVSSSRVTNLKTAKGFQENLVLFSDNGQFVLKGGDILTSKTVSITPITNFDVESTVEPLPLGSYLYFPFTRGAYTGLREFTLNASTDVYDSTEVTEHVPAYIPKNIIDMAGTTNENIITLLSGDEPSALYIYIYFWNGSQKVVSAWSKFTFEGEVRGVEFIDSTLYIVLTHNNETQLLELPLESGLRDPIGYTTFLDQRVETTVLAGNDTITLPYTPASEDTIEVYTKDGLKLSSSRTGSTVTLTQAVTEDTDVWLGYPFTMKYTFSELLFKASTGNSKSPSNAAKLKVRNGSLFYNDTAYFKVSVTPLYRDTYENSFTPNVVGSTTLGELNLDSGAYRFPVFSNAEDTKITITNDSALPSNFTSAEFESFVHSRSNRYAG